MGIVVCANVVCRDWCRSGYRKAWRRWSHWSSSQKTQPRVVGCRSNEDDPNLKGIEKRLTDIVFTPNGRWAATASLDRSIRLWDVRTGKMLARFWLGIATWIRSLAFQPDGSQLCSGGDDGAIRLWDLTKGTSVYKESRRHKVGFVQSCIVQMGFSSRREVKMGWSAYGL